MMWASVGIQGRTNKIGEIAAKDGGQSPIFPHEYDALLTQLSRFFPSHRQAHLAAFQSRLNLPLAAAKLIQLRCRQECIRSILHAPSFPLFCTAQACLARVSSAHPIRRMPGVYVSSVPQTGAYLGEYGVTVPGARAQL
jgi:hypothetical protein